MSSKEQRRTWVTSRLMAGERGTLEATHALGLSERSIRRLRARKDEAGAPQSGPEVVRVT